MTGNRKSSVMAVLTYELIVPIKLMCEVLERNLNLDE